MNNALIVISVTTIAVSALFFILIFVSKRADRHPTFRDALRAEWNVTLVLCGWGWIVGIVMGLLTLIALNTHPPA